MKYIIKKVGSVGSAITLFLISSQVVFANGSTAGEACPATVTFSASKGISGLICYLGAILNMIVPILVGAGLVVFIYGVVIYVLNSSSDDKRKEGTKFMLYGIVGLFVMVSVWGLVKILTSTFGLDTPGIPHLPQ